MNGPHPDPLADEIEAIQTRLNALEELQKVSLGILWGHMRHSDEIAFEAICGAIQIDTGGEEGKEAAQFFHQSITGLYKLGFIKADVLPDNLLIRVRLADNVEEAMRQLGWLVPDKK